MSSEPRGLRAGLLGLALAVVGCQGYGTVEAVPLADDLLTLQDRFFDVATADGERVLVVGYGGKILVSDDGGEHWRRAGSPTDKALLRIGFADRETGWIAGQDGVVLHTNDAGERWQEQASGIESHLFGLSVRSPASVFACGDRSRWIESTDGGAHWRSGTVPLSDVGMRREIAEAVQEPIYYDVTFLDAETGWMVGDYGNIRFTADGGATWKSQHQSLLGQSLPGYMRPLRDALDLPALFRVAMRDRQHGFATGVGGVLLETGDGGQRWRIVDTAISPRIEAPLLEIAFVGASPLVFGGGGVALRAEAGAWKRVDLGLPLLTWLTAARFASAGPRASRRGFVVGGRGMILRTDDGGAHWRAVGASPRASR
jgi:photosystem II stability/assembly factor-like uncharacterized protein